MLVKLRKSTFETNSSSAHTIILTNDNTIVSDDEFAEELGKEIEKPFTVKDLESDFKIPLANINFEQDFQLLTSWYLKLIYVIDSIRFNDKELRSLISVFTTRYPHFAGFETIISEDVRNDLMNSKVSNYKTDVFDIIGQIDHQSSDNLEKGYTAYKKLPEFKNATFEQYLDTVIFNKEFIIIVDSDSDEMTQTLFQSGFFKAENIKYILSNKFYERKRSKSSKMKYKTRYYSVYNFVSLKEYYQKEYC